MNPPNRVGDALAGGGVALGARAMTHSPTMIEVLGQVGLDFVWVDLEHGGPSAGDATALADVARAAEAGGVEPLVRLEGADGHHVRKALDAGIRTVLVPRVATAEEAREAVAAARFTYDGGPGERGAASGRAADWGAKPDDYVDREDETTTVGVMIENREAVEDVEAILSVPELGFAFVGFGDLSVSYGHPGETGHPEVVAAGETIREAATEANVPLGRVTGSTEAAAQALDDGYRIVRIGGDVASARTVLGERLETLREQVE